MWPSRAPGLETVAAEKKKEKKRNEAREGAKEDFPWNICSDTGAIPISDKRIIRKSEKLSTLRRSAGEGDWELGGLEAKGGWRGAADPLGDVSTRKLDSDDRSPFPYGSRSTGGWREVVTAKLIFERRKQPLAEGEKLHRNDSSFPPASFSLRYSPRGSSILILAKGTPLRSALCFFAREKERKKRGGRDRKTLARGLVDYCQGQASPSTRRVGPVRN